MRFRAFLTLDWSSAVPVTEANTQSGNGSPFLSHSARCCRRHRRSVAISCRDRSTVRRQWFFGVVTWPRTRFRCARDPDLQNGAQPAEIPLGTPHRLNREFLGKIGPV